MVFTMNLVYILSMDGRSLRRLLDSPFPSHAQNAVFCHATLQVLVFEREFSIPIRCSDILDIRFFLFRSLLTTKKVDFMICHERVPCVVGIHPSPVLLCGPSASGIVAPTFVWLLLLFLSASDWVDGHCTLLNELVVFFVARLRQS